MTKELLQQALDEAKADAIYVFTYAEGISAASKDAIEYMHSWLTVYFEKQALAQQEQSANRVYLVATGEVHEGQETYTRHDTPPPLCDYETLFTQTKQEQPASVDAYVGAREDAAIWKKRALEAEELNRKFIAELNGPTYLGEPVKQEQPAQEASATWTEMVVANLVREGVNKHRARELAAHFLTLPTQPAQEPCSVRITWTKLGTKFTDFFDFDNPACPISRDGNWKQDHWNARHLRQGNTGVKLVKLESVIMLYTHPATTQPALSETDMLKLYTKASGKHIKVKEDGLRRDIFRVMKAVEAHCRGSAQTQPALSDDEILNCFYASKSEGMVAYMLAVGRAIEAHCRGGAAS